MKQNSVIITLLLLAFGVLLSPAPPFYGPYSDGSTGGSATNVVLRGAVPGLLTTNGTGDWTLTGNASTATVATNAGFAEQVFDNRAASPSKGDMPHATTGFNSAFCFVPGDGVLDMLFGVFDFSNSGNYHTNARNVNLQIFTNVGSTTNPPAASNLCVNIPFSELMMNCYRFETNNPYGVHIDNDMMHLIDQSTNSSYGGYVKSFALKDKFKFPFTNSCLIRFTNTLYGSNQGNGYITVKQQSSNRGGPYAHWRLQNKRYKGSVTATISNFFFSVNSPAIIVGVQQSMIGTVGQNQIVSFEDSHDIRIQTASGMNVECSGGDDKFFSTYGAVAGLHAAPDSGVVNQVRDPDLSTAEQFIPMAAEKYRWYFNDPIVCDTNFVCYMTGAYSDLAELRLNIWYFAPMP